MNPLTRNYWSLMVRTHAQRRCLAAIAAKRPASPSGRIAALQAEVASDDYRYYCRQWEAEREQERASIAFPAFLAA